MNFGVMVITPDIAGEKVTGYRGRYDVLFPLIRECGYENVEIMLKNPALVDFDDIKVQAERSSLRVSAFCTGEMYGEDGISLADPEAKVRREALSRLHHLAEAALFFDAPITLGRTRGRYIDGIPRQNTEQWLLEGLLELCTARPRVRFLLEPVNRHYENFLMTTEEGVHFVKRISKSNVGIMLDYMHLFVEQEDLKKSVKQASPYLLHVHVCDSNRLSLGKGDFDIAPFLKELLAAGYDSCVSMEAFAYGDIEEELKLGRRALQQAYDRACGQESSINALCFDSSDNTLTLTRAAMKDDQIIALGASDFFRALENIPCGFKVASKAIAKGQKVFKYGKAIGTASSDILPGQCVHIHNIKSNRGKGAREDAE